MGSWTNWRRILTDLDTTYRILSFDQRGHGKSHRPAQGYAPEDYAADLLLIINELGWEKIRLVGHSMGGRNALVFADLHPTRVQQLVIEDIGPEGSVESAQKIEEMLAKVPTPFQDKRIAKEKILSTFPNQVLANYLYANIAETEPGVFDWRFSKEAILKSVWEGRSRDRWKEWESLKMPTLLIRGANSDEIDKDTFDKMLMRQPNAKGVEIPNAGHWVHYDQPALFSKALRDFFTS
jgi:pimeloyl-ACP methyl ester carboxylesterase